jgi:hypothetical protein
MPAKKPGKPDEKFPLKLTVRQRESLMHATRLTRGIKTRIKEAPPDQRFIEITKKELEKMGKEIDTALDYALPDDRKRLYAVIDSIDDLLADIDEKAFREERLVIPKSGSIYQFKVTLQGSNPRIWRRIQVADCTLGKLHEILQVVMGWKDLRPHRFMLRGRFYRPLEPEDCLWDSERFDEDLNSLSHVLAIGRRSWFTYEYDLKDPWMLRIALESTLEVDPKVSYPRCVEGAMASPPEDCVGVRGYAEFLEAVCDPNHESHEDMLRWVGGKFDSEQFDLDAVNRELRKL